MLRSISIDAIVVVTAINATAVSGVILAPLLASITMAFLGLRAAGPVSSEC